MNMLINRAKLTDAERVTLDMLFEHKTDLDALYTHADASLNSHNLVLGEIRTRRDYATERYNAYQQNLIANGKGEYV